MDNFHILSWWSKLSSNKQKIWLSIFIENMNVNEEKIEEKEYLEKKFENENEFNKKICEDDLFDSKINENEPLFERRNVIKTGYLDQKLKKRSKSMPVFIDKIGSKMKLSKSMEEFINDKLKETRIYLKETEKSLEEVNKLNKRQGRIRDLTYNIDFKRGDSNNDLYLSDF